MDLVAEGKCALLPERYSHRRPFMKTMIQGGYVVAFDGQGHRLIQDGVVVYKDDKIIH
jgi:hypothetical protein